MSRCISYWFENGEFSIQSCEFSGLQHIQPTNHQGGDGQILAVYDLGGGTFDISILEISGGVSWAAKWPETWHLTGSEISGPSPETNILTARPWKLMVGRLLSFLGRPMFRGLCLLVSKSVPQKTYQKPDLFGHPNGGTKGRSTGFQEWWDECFNENDMLWKRSHSRWVDGWRVWGLDDIFLEWSEGKIGEVKENRDRRCRRCF